VKTVESALTWKQYNQH